MRYQDNTKGVLANIRRISHQRAIDAATMVKNHAIAEMAKPKSGIEYRVPGTNVTYTASAPGEYPAIASGQLSQNISVSSQVDVLGVAGLINVTVAHGAILEAGLRPWLSRAADEKAEEVRKLFEAPWEL